MIQAAIIAGIILAIFGTGVTMGKKWEKSVWQPTYYTLAKQMTKLQSDLNLSNAESEGLANALGEKLSSIGKVSEVNNEKLQAEVNHRVERYLDKLLIAGLQPVPKEGNTGSESDPNTLSYSAQASIKRGGTGGLFKDLDRFERAALKSIIKRAEHSQTDSLVCRAYLREQEAKMKPLR